MRTLDFTSIIGRKDHPWFKVFHLDVDRKSAASSFDREPHVAWVDGLGDADYWAIAFSCGLMVGFEFLHHGRGAAVLATEPVAQHVGRHLNHWRDKLQEYSPDAFELDRNSMIELFSGSIPGLAELRGFQVWRQGDDGNAVKVGISTSRLDADCLQTELESHMHKQIYWVSRANDM